MRAIIDVILSLLIVILNVMLILLVVIFTSCSSGDYDKAKPNVNYKLDIDIEYNGHVYYGYAVLPMRPAYELRFRSTGKMDLFTFLSCSREDSVEKSKFQGSSKRAVVYYRPNEIEKLGACPITLGSYEQAKGRMAWGFIDFMDRDHTLQSKITCGGDQYSANGVSVCQQRTGLIQLIRFKKNVIVRPKIGCELESGNEGTEFRFNIKSGYCVYVFMSTDSEHEIHRATFYGYDDILMRNN